MMISAVSPVGRERVNAAPLSIVLLAASPTKPPDNDHDGINDELEQTLAERYAPVIYIEPDESNYPVNVEWMLDRARLQYHEDCTSDVDNNVGPFPIGDQLLGPNPSLYWTDGPNCGETDSGYSHPPHRPLTTIAADPDGQYSAGVYTTGYSDQQTFDLTDLPASQHLGSTDPRDWKTYTHAYPTADGGIMIQYWHVFAYNEFGGGFDNHGGDWDASIQVQLKSDLTLDRVWFSRHADDHPGKDFGPDQVRFFDTTHPVITIDGGGHAAFRSPDDWATCNCRVGESVTGPIGTVVWTNDTDDFVNPAALRKAQVVCEVVPGSPPLVCHTALSAPSGGIVWETWTDGQVIASGGLTHPLDTLQGAHGGLVNLGEYNPCTSTSCFGSAQASQLLAGQFFPLNNQRWLSYSGRWGSVGQINSGPRGPVFQGFEDREAGNTSIYRAWYNNGANSAAANDGSHPWLVPPTSTAALQGPTYTSNAVTYVAGTTTISLAATQSAIASAYGSLATYYRYYLSGGAAPGFVIYTAPFGLAPAAAGDGPYRLDYASLDGVGNLETTKTLNVTLDTTAPNTLITQPTATTYLHSASVTLSYSVSDSASGVATVVPRMDGASTLPDGTPLTSGQTINLLTQLTVGTHMFSIDAADNLANASVQSVTFSIVVTPDSIKDDVNQFLAANAITVDTGRSLLTLLNAAAAAYKAGDCATAAKYYTAFINQLSGLSGKKVDAKAARIMIADAQYLIAHCP